MLTNQLLFPPFPLSFRLQIQARQIQRVSCTFQGSTSVCPSLQAIWPPLSLQKLAICCGSHEVPATTMPAHLAIWSPILTIFTEKPSFLLSRIKLSVLGSIFFNFFTYLDVLIFYFVSCHSGLWQICQAYCRGFHSLLRERVTHSWSLQRASMLHTVCTPPDYRSVEE